MRTFASFCVVVLTVSIGHALTLKDSIDLALMNNPAVVSSQKKVDVANARLRQALGTFLPTLKLDGSYGKSYVQPSTVQFTTQTTGGAVTQTLAFGTDAVETTRSIGLSLSQPLFVAALWPGLKIAQKSADLAGEDLRKAVSETAFNVTQAYFGLLRAEKMVKYAEESREMARSHLDQVASMQKAGAASRADYLRGEVQLANSEVALTRAKNALEIARDVFNNAVGRDLEAKIEIEEQGLAGTVEQRPSYKELLSRAYETRPDWRQYRLTVDVGSEYLRVAQTAYLPTVMLNGQMGNRLTEYPTFSTDVNSWSIIGAAAWTLFDGFGVQSRIREAAANLESQKASEEQVKNGIALEVREAYLNLTSALETITSAKKAQDAAEENVKVSASRFASGAGTNVEVLDAQASLTQARINYLQALYDVEIAKAKINKVVGKGVL